MTFATAFSWLWPPSSRRQRKPLGTKTCLGVVESFVDGSHYRGDCYQDFCIKKSEKLLKFSKNL
jgi:hypothetical protein